MSNEPQPEDPVLGASVQQDPAETLTGDPNSDPLDSGYVPPDRPYAVDRFGTTAREQAEGPDLDERLREEEPEPSAFDDSDRPVPRPDTVDDERAGRLVTDDEGVRRDDTGAMTASDDGVDGGAASAEEAAVHLADEPDVDESDVDESESDESEVEVSAVDGPPPEEYH